MEFNLEDVYMPLFGASNSVGVKYDVIQKWFTLCEIIDGRLLTEAIFIKSYERICPNREDLSLAQFIQLIGILSRETRQDVEYFVRMFNIVRPIIVDEIVESRMDDDSTHS